MTRSSADGDAKRRCRRLFALAATVLAPLVSSCSFLLDFDELQSNGSAGAGGMAGGGSGGTSTDASTGGTGGMAGTGGSDACPGGCDDNDPCTENMCTPGGCQFMPSPGIVPDGFSQVLTAQAFHRVTMTSRGDRFYVSAFETTMSGPEVMLHFFGKTGTDLSPGVALTTLGEFGTAVPVSAAGLVAPEAGLNLLAYVAVGSTPTNPATVARLIFDLDLNLQAGQLTSATPKYLGNRRLYPIAWQPIGGMITAAWPSVSGGLFVHSGNRMIGDAETADMGAAQGQVHALAPLAAATTPGALYATDTGIHVQALGQDPPVTLGPCDAQAGIFTSAASGFTGFEGLWVGAWSKEASGGLVTEMRPLLCLTNGSTSFCGGSQQCDPSGGDDVLPNARNLVLNFLSVQGDQAGRVYEILASSFVDPRSSEGGIGMDAFRVDFNVGVPDAGVDVLPVTANSVELARKPLGTAAEGPNWPAMAVLPPDKIAVAWLQPSDSGGDELHIERHRICFPPP